MLAPAARPLLLLCLFFPPSLAHAQADVTEAQGSVEVFFSKTALWKRISKVPYRVETEDRVRTGLGSTAMITFPDGSKIQLGPGAAFTLTEVKKDKVELLLELGRLHSWVKKSLSRRFAVKTPTAVCSVRGTEFLVDIDSERQMDVEVIEGVVGVKTLLGEEISLGDGQLSRGIRILPDRPLDRPGRPDAAPAAPKQTKKEEEAQEEQAPKSRIARRKVARGEDGDFLKDVRREVALGLSKDLVQAAAAVEARRAEYQEGKTLIDVQGRRVRLEEYIVRPRDDEFKFVVLNERESRFDYFYYQARFNQALPEDLSSALRYLGGKTGAAPDYFITRFETGRSNTQDTILENGTGGHLVNAAIGAGDEKVIYDPDTNSFRTLTEGTFFWSTLFDNYSYKINGTEKYGWQPAAGANITSYDYVAGGFHTRILGGGANCALAGCAVAAPVNCTTKVCETAARPSAITEPDGANKNHQRVTITYAADGTRETYDFFVITDEGRVATTADFSGATGGGKAYKDTLLKFNYQQTIAASEFGGRTIDIVVEPKILVKSGIIP